ncbi:hypothetical protein HW509_07530 [Asaia spathodeae]|uniref:hypothetical protein n=1 Tax=Asaia spathodeae TaxID=657016 RepID=UPI002FC37870
MNAGVTRRLALTGLLPIAALAVAPSLAAGQSADSRLIEVCQEHRAIWASVAAIEAMPSHASGSQENKAREARISLLLNEELALLEEIASLPATTVRGLTEKAVTIRSYLPRHLADMELNEASAEYGALLSLLNDVARFGARTGVAHAVETGGVA